MPLELPVFQRAKYLQWLRMEMQTARIVRALWEAAGRKRKDADFLKLLVLFSWTNVGDNDSGYESTVRWRNGYLAAYLGTRAVPRA